MRAFIIIFWLCAAGLMSVMVGTHYDDGDYVITVYALIIWAYCALKLFKALRRL